MKTPARNYESLKAWYKLTAHWSRKKVERTLRVMLGYQDVGYPDITANMIIHLEILLIEFENQELSAA
jgi:hypothetical protein